MACVRSCRHPPYNALHCRCCGLLLAQPRARAGDESHLDALSACEVMTTLPALFVSHGAPTLIITPGPAREFLSELGAQIARPSAVLVISAHWESADPTVSVGPQPVTIHDFSGFPRELYAMDYPAPGAVEVAHKAAALLSAAGFKARTDEKRGLD